MDYRHFRYFLTLADELHFGRAAERLAISQPPLTVAVQQLEAHIGVPLFQRTRKSVQLTDAGRELVPLAQAALAALNHAVTQTRDVGLGREGNLTVGFVGTMLFLGLPQLLQRFEALHPFVKVRVLELSSNEQLKDLASGQLDVSFANVIRIPKGLKSLRLASQPLLACVPKNHPLASRKTIRVQDLQGEKLACVSKAVSADYHDRILNLCLDNGVQPNLRYEAKHWLSVITMVSQRMAIALVPEALRSTRHPGVHFAALQPDWVPYQTHAIWNPSQPGALRDALLDVLRNPVDRA